MVNNFDIIYLLFINISFIALIPIIAPKSDGVSLSFIWSLIQIITHLTKTQKMYNNHNSLNNNNDFCIMYVTKIEPHIRIEVIGGSVITIANYF